MTSAATTTQGELAVKVYYEDTDCLGLVYHASYLRFFERGRTELIGAALARSIADWNAAGYLFAVYKLEVTFRRAARLGDVCRVLTRFDPPRSEYRLCVDQRLLRGDELICAAQVQLVCLDASYGVRAFPAELLALQPQPTAPR